MSQLIATPSISCSQASWDQSNKGIILLLENWLSTTLLPSIKHRAGTKIQLNQLFPSVPSFSTNKESDIIQACERLTNKAATKVACATEGA